MRIVSLYDGMACGYIAFKKLGIDVRTYIASEIDKYAIQSAKHNFPDIIEVGDIFKEDFEKYEGFDGVIGGSPCTYWSIAQTQNRETVASGLGWDLFCQYVRALNEVKPKFFIYENNKSMSKEIRRSISEAFGFEPICINSALVSAQNRQRLYWVGIRQEDGTYKKCDIEQPEDRGIVLKDVLETGQDLTGKQKAYTITATYDGACAWNTIERSQRSMVAEPVRVPEYGSEEKGRPVRASYSYKGDGEGSLQTEAFPENPRKQRSDYVSEPVTVIKGIEKIIEKKGYVPEMFNAYNASEIKDKSPTLSTGSMVTSSCAVNKFEKVEGAVRIGCMPSPDGTLKNAQANRVYSIDGKSVTQGANGGGAGGKTGLYAVPVCNQELLPCDTDEKLVVKEATNKGYTEIEPGNCFDYDIPNSKTRRGRNMEEKSNCLTTSNQFYQYCGKMIYAYPIEWDEYGNPTKAISVADGKEHKVYKVEDGQITIKEKTYPIKLIDGFYIIRKLTVRECARLQTIPEWYEFPVSDSQAYKQIGNGWTIEVIMHLLSAVLKEIKNEN